jgi:hypothetical protein
MTSFDNYRILPNELKCTIWQEAAPTICENGVHHLKFTPNDPNKPNQVLEVQPKPPASDSSTWVERHEMKLEIDMAATREILAWEANNSLWIAPFKPRNRKGAVQNKHAKINGKTDMVVVYMSKDWTVAAMLHLQRNQARFRGLETVGIPYCGTPRWADCLSQECPWKKGKFCPRELGRLLCVFRSLKQFYFIYPLTGNRIIQHRPTVSQLCPSGSNEAVKKVKKTADVRIQETLDKISGTS